MHEYISSFAIPPILIDFRPTKCPIEATHINFRNHINFCTNNIEITKKNANSVAPPGRNSSSPGSSSQNQEHSQCLMCRRAVGDKPPGGFWEKYKNFNKIMQNKVEIMHL